MKRVFVNLSFAILLLSLTGCARSCEGVQRNFRAGSSEVTVRQFSGGKLIFERKFRGIINSSKESDGYYFTIGDTTFELSGDVQIIELP